MTVREIRFDGDTAFVPLTKGYEAVIDASDAPLVAAWNWHAVIDRRGKAYARRNTQVRGKWVAILMHRTIAGEHAPQVDHRDGDGLNNRRRNLRHATHQQNTWNAGVRSDNMSGYKGVHWNSEARKWRAAINSNGRIRYLGDFLEIEHAVNAYAEAAKAAHGEFVHQTTAALR